MFLVKELFLTYSNLMGIKLSASKFTANLYCICLSLPQMCAKADAVQICGKVRDTYCELKGPSFKFSLIKDLKT